MSTQHQNKFIDYTLDISNISLVYTMYIADIGIYQVYTNVDDIHGIYQGYTSYIIGIYQVYTLTLVYTWYIPGIYRLTVNIGDIGGIYHTKTSMGLFGTSHVPPSTGHIPDIYLLYPGI